MVGVRGSNRLTMSLFRAPVLRKFNDVEVQKGQFNTKFNSTFLNYLNDFHGSC